jgi:hypothetical protein
MYLPLFLSGGLSEGDAPAVLALRLPESERYSIPNYSVTGTKKSPKNVTTSYVKGN